MPVGLFLVYEGWNFYVHGSTLGLGTDYWPKILQKCLYMKSPNNICRRIQAGYDLTTLDSFI